MTALNSQRFVALFCVAVGFTACGHAVPLRQAADAFQHDARREPGSRETILHVFGNQSGDGANPCGGLIDVGGTFYGATAYGGAYDDGTVYEITPAGSERVLYSFAGFPNDGANPADSLIDVNGTLYGTTTYGGPYDDGTVYAVTSSGAESVLHTFGSQTSGDGTFPESALTNVGGILYGTTLSGGANDSGTVFTIGLSGEERVLYSFAGAPDGESPLAALTPEGGQLYGTTNAGGTSGEGTVFTVTTEGSESVLHSFQGGSDGSGPTAGLTKVGAVLYGTTYGGGFNSWGTVYTVTRGGAESVIHQFSDSYDGIAPRGGLTDVRGKLYGTTFLGGNAGVGAAFKVTKGGKATVLHRFAGGTDGVYPVGLLTAVDGKLYGVAEDGGNSACDREGCGVVYSLREH
jgi:uncharacterized repeat protein (TIGR03803 family)